MRRIYIDSNIFVDAEISEREHHKESKEFLGKVLGKQSVKVCTSIYTLLEIASAIRRQKGAGVIYHHLYDIQRKYKEGQVVWLPPSRSGKTYDFQQLIWDLIETAIRNATPSGDTIHVHTMNVHRIPTLITWDKKNFKHLKGKRRVLNPKEFLGSNLMLL